MAGLDPRLFGQPALNRRLIAPPALSTDLFRKSITDTEEEKEKSPLDYLEFLQAGEYLTAGITHSIVANEDLLKSIQEKHTFSELINEAFPEAPKAARVVAGFAASVVLDPLTYVGIGALTKAGKAAKVSGTLAATRAAQARAGQRALLKFAGTDIGIGGEVAAQVFEKGGKAFTAAGKLPGVGKVTNSFKNAFVTGHKLKGVKGGEIVQGEIDKFRVSLSKAYARAQEGDANILSLVPDKGRRLQLQRMYEDLEILSDEDLTKFIGQMSADPEAAALQMADIAHKAGMDKLTANEVTALPTTIYR